MKTLKIILSWVLTAAVVILSSSGVAEGAARFINYVPHDHYDQDDHDLSPHHDPTRHDADIKLPGRHYPKLPYTVSDPPFFPSYTQPKRPGDDLYPQPASSNDYNYHQSASSSHTSDYDHNRQPISGSDNMDYNYRQSPSIQDGGPRTNSKKNNNPHPSNPSDYDHHNYRDSSSVTPRPYSEYWNRGYIDVDKAVASADERQWRDDHSDHYKDDEYYDFDDDSHEGDKRGLEDEKGTSDGHKGTHSRHLSSPQSDTTGAKDDVSGPPGGSEALLNSPHFDRTKPRSVTVQAGKMATLLCRVVNIGDKSVSWMRQKDLHILTVGKYKYSTDGRISVTHENEEWRLRIKGVRAEDAGMYECQLSTKPILSYIVSLEVVDGEPPSMRDQEKRDHNDTSQTTQITVPSAVIVNGPAIHVHRGSLINLTCVVEDTGERPLFVVWYHYNKVVDYEGSGGEVVVRERAGGTVSQLLVYAARPSDSGKYTCRPSTGEDASVVLHVLDGENPAAMQTNGGRKTSPGFQTTLPFLFLLLMLLAPC